MNAPPDEYDPIDFSDLSRMVRQREARMTLAQTAMMRTRRGVIWAVVQDIRQDRREATERWCA